MERTISNEFIKAVRRKVEQFEYEAIEVEDDECIIEIFKDGVFICTLNNDGMGLVFEDSIPVFAKDFWNECEQLQKIYEMYDKGERLDFEGIGHYKVISSFEDTILAGAIDSNNEMVFVTWKYDDDRQGVLFGNYFLHDYNRAKLDFAHRAGLSKQGIGLDNGSLETIYKAVKYRLENDDEIGFDVVIPLTETLEKLEDTYDFLKETPNHELETEVDDSYEFDYERSLRQTVQERIANINKIKPPSSPMKASVYCDGVEENYLIENSAEEMAIFIMNNPSNASISIYTMQDELLVCAKNLKMEDCPGGSMYEDEVGDCLYLLRNGVVHVPPIVVFDEAMRPTKLELIAEQFNKYIERTNNMNELKPYQIEAIKEHYPKGTRITLDQMDEKGMPSGLEGTVEFVDDIGQIHMSWDNGRTLAIAPQVDKYHKSPVQEMEEPEEENINRYSDRINNTVLCNIDYDKLQDSYGTTDKAYAKAVLNELTQIAVEEYGTDYFDGFDKNEYVLVPGVLRNKATNEMCVALLELDLTSSGEHFNTYFLTKHGCVEQGDTEMPDSLRSFIRETYGSYEYAYPIGIETDHHVDFDNLHKDLQEFLDTFENYTDYISGERESNSQNPVKAIVSELDGSYKAYILENDPEQLATFIMNNSFCDKTEIYNSQGKFMVSTMGHFLNKCADMSIRDDLMKHLLPMQMGEIDVQPSVVRDDDMNEVTLNLFGDEQDNDLER